MEMRTIYEVKNSKKEVIRYTTVIQLYDISYENQKRGNIYLACKEDGIWVLLKDNGDIRETLGRENPGINAYFKKYEMIFYCRECRISAIGGKSIDKLMMADTWAYDKSQVNYVDKIVTCTVSHKHIYVYGEIIILVDFGHVIMYRTISNKFEMLYDLEVTNIVIDGESYKKFNIISIEYMTTVEDSTKTKSQKSKLFFNSNGDEMEISFIPKKQE